MTDQTEAAELSAAEAKAEELRKLWESLTQSEWTPDGSNVTFYFNKWPTLDAFDFMELLREIGIRQGRVVDSVGEMYAVTMAATREEMKEIRKELFGTVTWSKGDSEAATLTNTLNQAFAELTPDDVYMVMMRALAVNFTRGTEKIGATAGLGESGD